jgi:hypothetical protein
MILSYQLGYCRLRCLLTHSTESMEYNRWILIVMEILSPILPVVVNFDLVLFFWFSIPLLLPEMIDDTTSSFTPQSSTNMNTAPTSALSSDKNVSLPDLKKYYRNNELADGPSYTNVEDYHSTLNISHRYRNGK